MKTNQTGAMRRFLSPTLPPGRSLTYNVRARWTDATGKVIDETKPVQVQAGQLSSANFANAPSIATR